MATEQKIIVFFRYLKSVCYLLLIYMAIDTYRTIDSLFFNVSIWKNCLSVRLTLLNLRFADNLLVVLSLLNKQRSVLTLCAFSSLFFFPRTLTVTSSLLYSCNWFYTSDGCLTRNFGITLSVCILSERWSHGSLSVFPEPSVPSALRFAAIRCYLGEG